MTDELKEFESYNIKVKEYDNLYIKAYDKFIDEIIKQILLDLKITLFLCD
ncbi:hypothetical protein RhiirB3_450464 [Rhizophagus irregularis]|nr:hypothetical protein RhiirB3_450464 [Rhizophagus irregularis]